MFYTEPKITVLSRPAFAEPEHLPVQWIGDSTDGERLAEFAGRLCYMSQRNPANRTTRDYLENIKKQGHGSVLEHANYSLLLEGVSRSLTHELIRHRAGFAYCLSGDTTVECTSEHGDDVGLFADRTLEELYDLTRSRAGRAELTRFRLRCLDERSGTFVSGAISAIACSGLKPVYRVELADGRSIVSTKEHRFLTPLGWRQLEQLVQLSPEPAVKAGAQLVASPQLAAVAAGDRPEDSSVPFEVPDSRQTTLDLAAPETQPISRVTYAGEQMTYDIEMAGPNHNFVANGVVTHNSQLSQRYVDESQANFVVPPAMVGEEKLEASWREQIEAAQRAYVGLVEQLMERYGWVADKVHRRKMAREAARGVLPNSTETKIVVTGNARAWRTMLELRSSEGAELEIRRLAVAVLRVLQQEAPGFFSDFEIYEAEDRREAARISYHKV